MLKQKTKGYLLLDIQQSNINKRKPKIEYKGQTYYVIGGTYILPFTKSILSDYQEIINGLLLDTTFKILPSFVTSILMGSSFNTWIPLSFTFGETENKQLYEKHLQKQMNIDLIF